MVSHTPYFNVNKTSSVSEFFLYLALTVKVLQIKFSYEPDVQPLRTRFPLIYTAAIHRHTINRANKYTVQVPYVTNHHVEVVV